MRKKFRFRYVFLQVLLSLFQTQLSRCFPESIDFTSSKVTESKGSNEDQQISKQPYTEMFSETEEERRINKTNFIRKKRSLNSSSLIIENYNKLPSQGEGKLKSEEVQSGSAGNNLFKEITKKIKIRSDSSNKNPYVRRKRDLTNLKNMEMVEDSSKRKNDIGLIRKRESDDNSDSETERRKDSLGSSSRAIKSMTRQEPAEYSSVNDFEVGSQLESKDSNEEEDTEEERNEQENLNRSKRECDQNPNIASAKNPLIQSETDYEETINQNDDDSNIQEEEYEENKSESRNKSRFKRNEEDSDKNYEKELKSMAKVEKVEESNAVNKRQSDKKSHLEKRQLKSESKRNARQIQKINNEDSRGLREEVENLEMENLDLSKNNIEDQRLQSNKKLQSDKKLERFDKESNENSAVAENIDLDVRENESEDNYEKRVAEQIQQRIDAIKEEIKREVEEKQKIEKIEENNDKYDELQSQEDEDVCENQDSSNQEIIFKRSLKKRNPNSENSKRRTVKRRRRSNPENRQQSLKENKKINSGYQKVQLRHESIRKRSAPEYGSIDTNPNLNSQDLNNKENISKRSTSLDNRISKKRAGILIPEQAQIKIEEKVPDSKLGVDSSPLNGRKVRLKRSNSRFSRRNNKKRRANNLVSGGRLGYLKYRPQNIDDDDDDEGNEFEDDGFDDQTSNLDESGSSILRSSADFNSRYEREDDQLNDPVNFLFDNRELTKQKLVQSAAARNSRKKRFQLKKKKRRKRTSAKNAEERTALDYKEAFGGHQRDPNEALTRFKRIKRVLRVS